ncbi:MAG: glutaminyl-tRNA synthetase [Homavirus sp.]|uniref:glutamine--tRNA ligase n=1 Tax=Homavirus sp. TaxID=2487769 RepID=A0A3G5A6B7_9VIRU|nr:MAG: glutaminyl-tRNA synthetase [Homavirus sp.]
MKFNLPNPEDNIQTDSELLTKHLSETKGKIVTRFPPEPNGYLHIGHAKAMYINFTFAKINNGVCYLRFDDTNPTKEKQEYIDSIISDVKWLTHTPYKITYTSDYFDQLYEYAIQLIKTDKAYVCELDEETMRTQRYNGIDSPFRSRSVEESLKLFEQMRNKKYGPNTMVLRMKGDMTNANPNMRDLVAYRILNKVHPRTGDKWVIYPTYDFSHPIVDSMENITHSLCSMEFQTRNELYRWIPEMLHIYRPPQIEYCRLNITHCILSKRKLIELVSNNVVSGWDDPRMPTLLGLKRRGYTPEAINNFCNKIGMSVGNSAGVVDYRVLQECLRQDLENKAPRVMAIMNPLKVNITNMSDSDSDIIQVSASDFPNQKENSSTHTIKVSNIIYIDHDDFRMVDSPKYFRLAPNKIVRLKYFGLICCTAVKVNTNNEPLELDVELLQSDYKPPKRVQGTINWVSDIDHLNVCVRKYDHLFPEQFNECEDWINSGQLNLNSKMEQTVMTDSSIKNAKVFDNFQFERIGYFTIDSDSCENNIVMNMSVSLKEDKGKNG